MSSQSRTTDHGHLLHRPSSSGLAFWGPGDSYRFPMTGAESGGAYFAMLERAKDPDQPPPDNLQDVAARYAEAAPRYGIELLVV